MSLWYTETFGDKIRFGLRVERTLFSERSEFQLIEVFETAAMGKALAIDGLFMTSERDEHYYHEMIVHPAMVTVPGAKRVLIIGGGDGGTAREVLRHPTVEQVVMVEIDGMVVDACKEHLPGLGNWNDPRLELIIGDGIDYVKRADADSFDIVLLDGSDPVGPAEGLFNASFYANVKNALRPGGVFALQSESPLIQRPVFLDVVRTVGEMFNTARPYFGPVLLYGAGQWSWTYATDSVDPMAINEAQLAHVESDCKYYNRDIHRGAFALPNDLRGLLA